jgi:hypothetical protein
MRRKLGKLPGDFAKRQSDSLRENDERNSSQDLSRKSSLRVSFALRADKAALLVEAEG